MPDPRPLRDILAECLVLERLGISMRPWERRPDEANEQDRIRADRMLRMLAERGVAIGYAGDPELVLPPPVSDVIYRYPLVGKEAERLIRHRAGRTWQLALVADGAETVEQEFSLDDGHQRCGLVLTDDPGALSIKGLGRQFAAMIEIYRMGAEAMST